MCFAQRLLTTMLVFSNMFSLSFFLNKEISLLTFIYLVLWRNVSGMDKGRSGCVVLEDEWNQDEKWQDPQGVYYSPVLGCFWRR